MRVDSADLAGALEVRVRTSPFRRLVRIALLVVVASTVLIGCSSAGALWYFGRNLPDYHKITEYHPPANRQFVSFRALPPALVDAFVSAEDRNFFSHPGIDISAILRAALVDVVRLASGQRPIGASTITQQVVRHFVLSDKLTFARKVKEALLALRIERVLSKDRIFELYVNSIYFGCGSVGVSEAAHNYFGVSVANLTLPQAALIAGLPQAPNYYNPWRRLLATRERRNWVIDRMAEDGYITAEQAKAAKSTPVLLAARRPRKAC